MTLFDSHELRGGMTLNNRVVMAPMTRSRAGDGDVITPLAAEYYAQRSTAGLIVSEGVIVSPAAKGYSLVPGLYNQDHAAAWKKVTDAVHSTTPGSRIFAQIWHVGRVSNPEISGHDPIAPTAIRPPAATLYLQRPGEAGGPIGCGEPREMTQDDIDEVVEQFRASARLALAAGFDGVELHAANGYLIDQFMRATTNHRQDGYGGDVSNRLRFLREVTTAVIEEVGAGRVGVRFSPIVEYGDTADPTMESTILQASSWLDEQGVAYLHVIESDSTDLATDSAQGQRYESVAEDFQNDLRASFSGALVLAYRYDVARAEAVLAAGTADLVAFGRPFIANPDLVERMAQDVELADSDVNTWYGGDAIGYTDYPAATTPSLA